MKCCYYIFINIVARIPPHIVNFKTWYTAYSGYSAVLDCNATGVPKPAIVWSKDNRILYPTDGLLPNDTGQLVLTNITYPSDVGSYKCTVINHYGIDVRYAVLSVLISSSSSYIHSVISTPSLSLQPSSSVLPTATVSTTVNDNFVLYFLLIVYLAVILCLFLMCTLVLCNLYF